jgi:hypothetical protein
VWQNQYNRSNPQLGRQAVQLMVTVEPVETRPDVQVSLRQLKPKLTWFSLAAKDKPDQPVSGVKFFPLPGYPAPAWRLEVDEWADRQSVVLNTWFTTTRPVPAVQFLRRKDYNTLSELTGRKVPVGPNAFVRVESVTWMEDEVEVRPGAKGQASQKRRQGCLVVRLSSSDPTKRFFAQLPDDFTMQGHEHRFYTEAGKYTGVFWNVSEAQANALNSLELISVDEARQKAIEVKNLDLGEPSIGGDPPIPPLSLNY